MAEGKAGWVLTGGKSSRMGADKALIPHASGIPLALHAAGELKKVCNSVSLVGDPAVYSELGLRVIPDRFAGLGPLAGIEAALGATESESNLIVACDMPSLDSEILGALLATLAEEDTDCALPQYEDGRVEPLCAAYRRRCHPVILQALENGIRKVTGALRGLEIRYVRVTSAAPFANLNTPEELHKYRNG